MEMVWFWLRECRMFRKYLICLMVSAVALVAIGGTFMHASGKRNLVTASQSQAAVTFYFGRTVIDIKAADSAVPRVDVGTIAPHENLILEDQFYPGQTNASDRLVYLETWTRIPEGEVALNTMVDGKPLRAHSITQHGDEVSSQELRVFTFFGTAWQEVTPQATEGETRFCACASSPLVSRT